MNYHHFKVLCSYEKFQDLILHGNYLAEREVNGAPALLFELYGGYVELFFNKKSTKIVDCWAFEDTEFLDPYLEQISLADALPL
jgi:hypothetical protein